MTDASIAFNRFGLGATPDTALPADPRKWLLAQFDRFEPRPAAIAALPRTLQIAGEFFAYQRLAIALRRDMAVAEKAVPPVPQPAVPGAMTGDVPGAMAGTTGTATEPEDRLTEARRAVRQQANVHYFDQAIARAQVAVQTPAPFVERLVHFWANHFAVSADQLEMIALSGAMEFEAIRPHVLGNFGAMLNAVERHPAMLFYLDQSQSTGSSSPAGLVAARRGQKRGLNENLAREILELHTLGVRTGYSQADVTEFARAMTGWTVAGFDRAPPPSGVAPGSFVFAARLHEPGVRTILGKTWPQQGQAQAAAVLDMLAVHPATARHIATKLGRHFAGDAPPPALVARLESAFLRSGGDLPSVYRVLVDSPECWVPQPVKFKTPWEWAISVERAMGTQEQKRGTISTIAQLGQPVWRPGSPAGWDDVAGSWAGPDAIMRRVEAAERIAQRTRNVLDPRQRAGQLFPGALSAATEQAIARAESPSQGVALMLVAPEFMRR